MDPSTETRRRRLRFRCAHRGTRELDLVLGRFAEGWLDRLSEDQLGRLEAVLDAGEPRLEAWLIRGEPAPPEHESDVLALMRAAALGWGRG
jgi:antitoxin CptB